MPLQRFAYWTYACMSRTHKHISEHDTVGCTWAQPTAHGPRAWQGVQLSNIDARVTMVMPTAQARGTPQHTHVHIRSRDLGSPVLLATSALTVLSAHGYTSPVHRPYCRGMRTGAQRPAQPARQTAQRSRPSVPTAACAGWWPGRLHKRIVVSMPLCQHALTGFAYAEYRCWQHSEPTLEVRSRCAHAAPEVPKSLKQLWTRRRGVHRG